MTPTNKYYYFMVGESEKVLSLKSGGVLLSSCPYSVTLEMMKKRS